MILVAAEEMGHQKNIISSSLALKSKKIVYAFLVKSLNKYFSLETRRGLEEAVREFSQYEYKIKIIETDMGKPELQLISG